MMSSKFYSGTSGIILPFSNKTYYPDAFKEKSRLNVYGSMHNSVEINSSFYKIPQRKTVEKWSADVPEDFKFTFKLFKGITHATEARYNSADIVKFFDVINGVGHKKGCLLVQLPPSFKLSRLQELKILICQLCENNRGAEWNIALEFRDSSWYNSEVYELIDLQNMGLVLHDKPASATPFNSPNVNFAYLRFHGPSGNYRESYSDDFLAEYASYIQEWLGVGKDVFAYFNNTMGEALLNLATLRSELR